MSWSSGKEGALPLHEAREAGAVEVTRIITTAHAAADRVPSAEMADVGIQAVLTCVDRSVHGGPSTETQEFGR